MMIELASDRVRVVANPEGGFLDKVVFHHPGLDIGPMHRAPWLDEPVPADVPIGWVAVSRSPTLSGRSPRRDLQTRFHAWCSVEKVSMFIDGPEPL